MQEALSALIVEDEAKHRETLMLLLDKYCPAIEVKGEAESVAKGVELAQTLDPDVLFVDVELEDGDCFELLEQFEELSFAVIFITAHDHYAIRAIKFAALDYLLKPIIVSELKAAVAKVQQHQESQWVRSQKLSVLRDNLLENGIDSLNRIALPTVEGFTFVEIGNIVRLEADRAYTRIHFLDGGEVTVSRSLGEYEEMLNKQHFFRIHNSHLINLKLVHKYLKGKGGYVVMNDGATVNVSMRRKDAFLERLKQS